MIRRAINIGALFCLLSCNSIADFAIYTIDNQFEVALPAPPRLVGELGEGKQKHKSYDYTDERNMVVYTATYQVGITRFRPADIPVALSNYVKGQALSVAGIVTSYSNMTINNNESAVFLVTYQHKGMTVRKYGVVSYKDGHFYQWTVQDSPSISSLEAKTIFNEYIGKFLVK